MASAAPRFAWCGASTVLQAPEIALRQVQCTHPRSDSRVKMLTEELDMMREHGDTALDRVMHPVSYWSL